MWFDRKGDGGEERKSSEAGSVKELLDDAREWLEKRIELFLLHLVERLTFLLADAIQRLVGLVIFVLGAFFFWFALSFMVSEWVGSMALGFLITSVPLLLAGGIFLWIQPGRIRRAIQAGMIRQFLRAFDESVAGEESASARRQRDGMSDDKRD